MKTKKSIALLLCLLLTLTLCVPSSAAFAAEGDSGSDNGMVVNKTATANDDGTYTIKLEAYATGSKVITEVKEDVPTDIVLVLDQSGSMENSMPTTTMTEYTNKRNANYYANRHNGGNGNLWHKLSDGSYVSVSVDVTNTTYSYTEYNATSGNQKNNEYYQNQANLFYLDSDGKYCPISVEVEYSGLLNTNATYTYSANGEPIATGTTSYKIRDEAFIDDTVPNVVFYTRVIDYATATYTYTYTAADNTQVRITSSTGSEGICDVTFYSKTTNSSSTRLDALKTAVNSFVDNVAKKAAGEDGDISTKDDNINHRIAIVGFASKSDYGNNTELLSISGTNSGTVGVAYNSISDQNYKDVLQDMNTTAGQSMVNKAINALAAEGATRTDLGLKMAKNILDKNPVQDNEKRNRVVIVFTDGAPTTNDGFKKSVANDAISEAAKIKNGGTSVYSVGIFSGADATSPGTEPSGNLGNTSSQIPAASNWFMQKLSSNNGKVQTPSYYLSAADADTLKNIFQQISDQIETGGSSTTLTSEAVVKDIIAPQFTLPEGATASDITLETYKYTGEGTDPWEKNSDAMGATATVNGDMVSVTGFNFSENWCGTVDNNGKTEYRGNKLEISFTVSPKAGFLGGNNVYTNTSAGIYQNSSATDPVKEFNRPQVNVPIKTIAVDAVDQNVYLLADVSVNDLKDATTVKVGDVELNLTATNYGLQDWQTAYVTIQPEVTYSANPDIEATDLTAVTDDKAYTVAVTVAPKEEPKTNNGPAATSKSGHDSANINVFKPVLTFKDSKADYLSEYPNGSFTLNNYVSEVWKHGETLSTGENVVMIGTEPELELIYTPDANSIDTDNKIIATDDFAVNVRVNYVTGKDENGAVTSRTPIDLQYVTFDHQSCSADSGCGWSYVTPHAGNVDAPEFLIHVENVVADLKITKTGLDVYAYGGDVDRECAIITVTVVDGNISTVYKIALSNECSTATIKDLKVGSRYTISEDNDWTWRYKNGVITGGVVDTEGNRVIDKTSSSNVVIITNGPDNPYWLGGDNYRVNKFEAN